MPESGHPLRVYTLEGLSPEVAAVTFAKTSRSPRSFDDIARELTETASTRFHEKWVIGYGHSSVAEHAVLSIAIENLSILAAKIVEENRLSSFTEKSTRYQVMAPGNYYTPGAFEGVAEYRDSISALYDAYHELLGPVGEFCEHRYGSSECRAAGLSPSGKACDAVRGLLPAAAKTNLGWTVNARSLRHAVVKLRSHPLAEMRELGDALERIGSGVAPTLLRHTEASPYLEDWARERPRVSTRPARPEMPSVRLVSHDDDGEERVAAALLFGAGGCSYREARERALSMTKDEVGVLLSRALQGIGGHEAPVRGFESTTYVFEITCDFGAYRDVQRHRMTTQIAQPLGCELGYTIPEDAVDAGVADRMRDALERARDSWLSLSESDPLNAQYAVPLAFLRRFTIQMNYREAYVFVRLRSRVQGHESYRRIAWAVRDEIERVHPALGRLIPVDRELAVEPAAKG